MFRRTVIKALTVAAGSAALTACSSEDTPAAQSTSPTPSTTPRTENAAFEVGTHDISLSRGSRSLETRLWYPQTGGPYPLILFSHGLTAHPNDWKNTLSRWAQAGFVVAAPAYPFTNTNSPAYNDADVPNQPADAQYVITQVLQQESARINPAKIGASGHSAGGITTLGLFSKVRDNRLAAGIVMAGRQDFGFKPYAGPEATLLFVQGEQDRTVLPAQARAAYDAAPWKKAYMSFPDSDHLVDGPAGEVVTETSIDFWRWTLNGDTAAMARLRNDAIKDGLARWTASF